MPRSAGRSGAQLGRQRDVRRFVAGLMVTTRHHLTSRPISFANERFFQTLALHSDRLLEHLREPGWEKLDSRVEAGLDSLRFVRDWPADEVSRQAMGRAFTNTYRQHFKGLSVPWSCLAATERPIAADWPRPGHILLAVGPNIGIGDEMILFRAVRRLHFRYPESRLLVSSTSPNLWSACEVPHQAVYPTGDPLAMYRQARRLLRQDPSSLVVFAEFASAPIYRLLEAVEGFTRFLYIDTGAALGRAVDQAAGRVAEYAAPWDRSVYAVLDLLLDSFGLPAVPSEKRLLRPRSSAAGRPRIFVNPFSSKEAKQLTPSWWAGVLQELSSRLDLEAEIFSGISAQTRAFAGEIAEGFRAAGGSARMTGSGTVHPIEETLQAASACDLILGLDTFTAHIGVLHPIPCVTVSFGPQWAAWRVPDAPALYGSIIDSSRHVARLALRFLEAPLPAAAQALEAVKSRMEAVEECLEHREYGRLLALVESLQEEVGRLVAADPEIARDFADPSPSYFAAVVQTLRSYNGRSRGSEAFVRWLQEAWRTCRDSNFARWVEFEAGQESARLQ